MANDCLITKLKKAVNNSNLPYFGFGVAYIDTTGMANVTAVPFVGDKTGTKILGEGTFADGTTEIVDNASLRVNPNTVITILYPKYNCFPFPHARNTDNGVNYGIVTFNMDDLEYCSAADTTWDAIRLSKLKDGHKMEGDLDYLMTRVSKSILKNLIIDAADTYDITVNLSSLIGCTSLLSLNLQGTKVEDNISSLSGLTTLTGLTLANTNISGDIQSLSNLTSLTSINLSNSKVSGSIESLSDLTLLAGLRLENTNLYGDRGTWFRNMCQDNKEVMKARTNDLQVWITPNPNIQDTMLNTTVYVKYVFTGTSTVNIYNGSNVKIAEYDIDTDVTTPINA